MIKVRTFLSASALFLGLKRIEFLLGRKPSKKLSDRIIDIDIVLYEDLVMESESLSIPHPKAWERAFVIYPLLELKEPIFDPKSGRSLEEIYREKKESLAKQHLKMLEIHPPL